MDLLANITSLVIPKVESGAMNDNENATTHTGKGKGKARQSPTSTEPNSPNSDDGVPLVQLEGAKKTLSFATAVLNAIYKGLLPEDKAKDVAAVFKSVHTELENQPNIKEYQVLELCARHLKPCVSAAGLKAGLIAMQKEWHPLQAYREEVAASKTTFAPVTDTVNQDKKLTFVPKLHAAASDPNEPRIQWKKLEDGRVAVEIIDPSVVTDKLTKGAYNTFNKQVSVHGIVAVDKRLWYHSDLQPDADPAKVKRRVDNNGKLLRLETETDSDIADNHDKGGSSSTKRLFEDEELNTLHDVKTQFERAIKKQKMIEHDNVTKTEEIGALKAQLADKNKSETRLSQTLHQMEQQHIRDLHLLKDAAARSDTLEKQLGESQTLVQQTMTQMKLDKSQMQQTVQFNRQSHMREMQKLRDQMQKTVAEKVQIQVETMQQQHAEAEKMLRDGLNKSHVTLTNIGKRHATEVESIKEKHTTEVAEMKQKHDAEMRKTEQELMKVRNVHIRIHEMIESEVLGKN